MQALAKKLLCGGRGQSEVFDSYLPPFVVIEEIDKPDSEEEVNDSKYGEDEGKFPCKAGIDEEDAAPSSEAHPKDRDVKLVPLVVKVRKDISEADKYHEDAVHL